MPIRRKKKRLFSKVSRLLSSSCLLLNLAFILHACIIQTSSRGRCCYLVWLNAMHQTAEDACGDDGDDRLYRVKSMLILGLPGGMMPAPHITHTALHYSLIII